MVEVLSGAAAARIRALGSGGWRDAAGQGGHAVYRLSKRSVTTIDATGALGRALGVGSGAVRHAGLKDKHALTVQHVSVPVGEGGVAGGVPAGPVEGAGWRAEPVGVMDRALSAGDIERNEFEITVRGLTRAGNQRLGASVRARAGLGGERGGEVLLINAFGSQRFGSARAGAGWVASRLVEGDFLGAVRLAVATPSRKDTGVQREFARVAGASWEAIVAGGSRPEAWARLAGSLPACPQRAAVEALGRGQSAREAYAALPTYLQELHVDAYQSWLWNRAAALACGTTCDPRGGVVQPGREAIESIGGEPVLAMPAPGVELRAGLGGHLAAVLAQEGLSAERLVVPGLRRPRFESFDRALLVRARGFAVEKAEPDELDGRAGVVTLKRLVRFWLPAGSYATVVLGAIGVGE